MEPLRLFDTHAHYDDPAFEADRDSLLGEALPLAGVRGIITAGTSFASCAASQALAERYPYVWFTAGIHPEDAERDVRAALGLPEPAGDGGTEPLSDEQIEEGVRLAVLRVEPFLRHEKCVAVGEIGLDYHWPIDRRLQNALFTRQLELAAAHNLPVVIHDREAHADTLAALRRFRPRGTVHCFSGSAEMAKEVLALGLYLGFTGSVTFKNNKKAPAVLAATPCGRILTETDCPYMAPEPLRGSRCDSSMISRTLPFIAQVKGVEETEAARFAEENARALFGL